MAPTLDRTDAAPLLADLIALPPEQRADRVRAEASTEDALLALGDEVEHLAIAEVARGLVAGGVVVALADAIGLPRSRSRTRRAWVNVLNNAGRFEESVEIAEAAAGIAAAGREPVEGARALVVGLLPLAQLGRYRDAVRAGETARVALLEAGEPALAARADINLGAVFAMWDEPGTALTYFDRAHAALHDEPIMLAHLETNRGNALSALGRFDEAERAFATAGDACADAGLDWLAAIAESDLAHLAARQGKLAPALAHFERARRYLEQDESPAHLASLLAERADTLATLGLPADALAQYQAALVELDGHGLSADAAQTRAGLGRVLVRLGRHAEAEDALDAAADAFARLGHDAARARTELVRADLLAARGERPASRARLDDALAALADRPVEATIARAQLARLHLDEGNLPEARDILDVALSVARDLDLAPVRADLLHSRGLLHRAEGRSQEALADLRAAVEQVERVRGALQAERFRAAFLGQRLAVYEDAVLGALDLGGPAGVAEAFTNVERAKSRALLDLIGGSLDLEEAAHRAPDPGDAALLAELARIRADLNWAYSHAVHHAGDDDDPGAPPDAVRADLARRREDELDALGERIAVARGPAALYAPPVDLGSAHRLVPDGGALVEYFAAGDELLAFVLRGGEVAVVRGLAAVPDVTERLRRLRFQIGRALVPRATAPGPRADRLLGDVRRELGALHDLLFEPLAARLAGAERLVVVPHGPLHTVPFAALWDARRGRYLVEEREVRLAPSASVLARLPAPGGEGALVAAVPDEAAPLIAAEAGRVAAVLGAGQVLLGPEATAERVAAAAGAAATVHLACHGRFLPDRPLTSGLKLADRWLTVRDAYDLRLQADLVTLSGCETGRSAVGGGDELIGLIRGLFAAGAASVLVSLWAVHDAATADLMAAFYDARRGGAPKPAALRAAQLDLLARRPHPAFWAPFVLEGNP